MTADEGALIRAVAAAGADPAPRLVYADWLDEHGESERAAFVRDQVLVTVTPADTPERRAAAWRAFEAERSTAGGGPARSPGTHDWQFRAGFPDLVGLTAAKLRRNAPTLFAHAPVRSLLVTGLAGEVEMLGAVPADSGVERLSLWGARLTAAHLPALAAALRGLPRLTALSLLFNELADDAVSILTGKGAFAGLTRLEVGANPFTDAGRDRLRAALGDRVTFACEREDDYLYRIQSDDPFYNGIDPDGMQYVTRDGLDGLEVARFDAAGNFLGAEALAYDEAYGPDDDSFLDRRGVREGTVQVKRFRHADGRGIKGLPALDESFGLPTADRGELEFAYEVLESWLYGGEFAFGHCILNRDGAVIGT